MDTIPNPQNEEEAINLCVELSGRFKFWCVFIQKSDFQDHEGTENWTEEHYENATELAGEEVADQVGYALQNSIETINESK